MDAEAVRDALRSGGDEYHYRDANCDIGGHQISESGVEIKHFVVKRAARNQGIASTLLDALLDVLREEGMTFLKMEMGATECYSLEELEEYRERVREEQGLDADADVEDPSWTFLANRGFSNLEYVETFQWGLVVRASRMV